MLASARIAQKSVWHAPARGAVLESHLGRVYSSSLQDRDESTSSRFSSSRRLTSARRSVRLLFHVLWSALRIAWKCRLAYAERGERIPIPAGGEGLTGEAIRNYV